jgi:hypothetical protein
MLYEQENTESTSHLVVSDAESSSATALIRKMRGASQAHLRSNSTTFPCVSELRAST